MRTFIKGRIMILIKKEDVVYIINGIMTYNHDDCDNVDNHNDGMTLLPPK